MRTGCAVRRRQKQFGELFLTRGPLGESVLSHQKIRLVSISRIFSYIRLRRVILLRSDVRLKPSDIALRAVKERI